LLSCIFLLTAQAAQGEQWLKESKSVAGGWSVEHKDDGDYLVLDENLETSKGLILS
jgi:hypothetical protein